MENQNKSTIEINGNLNLSADNDNFRLGTDGNQDEYLSTKGFQIAVSDYYSWEPKEDITAYELAECLPIVVGMQTMGSLYHNWKQAVNDLPENCQRHFAKVEG